MEKRQKDPKKKLIKELARSFLPDFYDRLNNSPMHELPMELSEAIDSLKEKLEKLDPTVDAEKFVRENLREVLQALKQEYVDHEYEFFEKVTFPALLNNVFAPSYGVGDNFRSVKEYESFIDDLYGEKGKFKELLRKEVKSLLKNKKRDDLESAVEYEVEKIYLGNDLSYAKSLVIPNVVRDVKRGVIDLGEVFVRYRMPTDDFYRPIKVVDLWLNLWLNKCKKREKKNKSFKKLSCSP